MIHNHQIIIPSPRDTPSSKDNVSRQTEFVHRIHGTSIIYLVTKILNSPSVYPTATAIFHRFYHRQSLKKYDVWSASAACLLLGCKIEEQTLILRDIILAYAHVFRRIKLGLDLDYKKFPNTHHGPCSDNKDKDTKSTRFHLEVTSSFEGSGVLPRDQKLNILRHVRPMPQHETLYKEWEGEIVKMENVILRELGFSLNWIPESHPHKFLLYFINVMELGNSVGQLAWNYCNDSSRLDLCVRHSPELIACGSIHLSCIELSILLPLEPMPWWHAFVGTKSDSELSIICNALLALKDEYCVNGYYNAMHKYVVSLIEDGSFCDPGSYIWNAYD